MRVRFALILILALCYGFLPATPGQAQQSATETGRKVLRKVPAEYPVEARRMNLAGTVKVVAVVAPDGSVKRVDPLGGSPILVQAAQNAISRWRYAPGAESIENIELHFTPGN